jgi:hypothetical protein
MHRILRTSCGACLAAIVLLACGDDGPLVPGTGATYRLRSINGRPLPTTYSSGPVSDSMFLAWTADQYRVLSDSVILHDVYLVWTQVNPDGSVTYPAWGCWENFPYLYRQRGDSLILTSLAPTIPGPPTPSALHLRTDHLLELGTDSIGPIRLRYEPAAPIAQICPEVARGEATAMPDAPIFRHQ